MDLIRDTKTYSNKEQQAIWLITYDLSNSFSSSDIKNIIENTDDESIKKELNEILKINEIINKNSFAELVGSYPIRPIRYAADIDINAMYTFCCNPNCAGKKMADYLQNMVRTIKAYNSIHSVPIIFSEFKGGFNHKIDKLYNLVKSSIIDNNSILKELKYKVINQDISDDEYKKMRYMVNTNKYKELKDFVRNLNILRWSGDDILRGFKIASHEIIYLSAACTDLKNPYIKVDLFYPINSRYIEVTCVIRLNYYDIDENKIINLYEPDSYRDFLIGEYKKYIKYFPFKALKRMYNIARLDNKEDIMKKLTDIFNSPAGIAYVVMSDSEVILEINNIFKNLSSASNLSHLKRFIDNEIDYFNARLQPIELSNEEMVRIHNITNKAINNNLMYLNELNKILLDYINKQVNGSEVEPWF